MDRLSLVLHRIAAELDDVAGRLSRLTISDGEAPVRPLSSKVIAALQEIDRSEQVTRSIGDVLKRLAIDSATCGSIDTIALSEGISLDSVKVALLGQTADAEPAGNFDIF